MSEKPGGVFDDLYCAVSVDYGVVPGGDDLAVFGFFRVPGGSDVVVGAGKNCEGFNGRIEFAPLWISSGDVSAEDVRFAFAGRKHHGEVGCDETRAAHCDQSGEGLCADEAVEDFRSLLFVELWDVHGLLSRLAGC